MGAPHQEVEAERGGEQHVVEADEEAEAKGGAREQAEGGGTALLPERERPEGEEQEELRHRLCDRIAREPDLDDVHGEEQPRDEGDRRPEDAPPGEEDGEGAEHAEEARGGQGSAHAHGLEQVRAKGGKEMEELGHDASRLRAVEGHAHEPPPRRLAALRRAVEEADVLPGDREHDGIHVRDTARTRDQRHRRNIGAGIAAAHHVFAGPRLQGERGEQDGERGDHGAEPGPSRPAAARASTNGGEDGPHRRERSHHQRCAHRREAAHLAEHESGPRGEGHAGRYDEEQRLVQREPGAVLRAQAWRGRRGPG